MLRAIMSTAPSVGTIDKSYALIARLRLIHRKRMLNTPANSLFTIFYIFTVFNYRGGVILVLITKFAKETAKTKILR